MTAFHVIIIHDLRGALGTNLLLLFFFFFFFFSSINQLSAFLCQGADKVLNGSVSPNYSLRTSLESRAFVQTPLFRGLLV